MQNSRGITELLNSPAVKKHSSPNLQQLKSPAAKSPAVKKNARDHREKKLCPCVSYFFGSVFRGFATEPKFLLHHIFNWPPGPHHQATQEVKCIHILIGMRYHWILRLNTYPSRDWNCDCVDLAKISNSIFLKLLMDFGAMVQLKPNKHEVALNTMMVSIMLRSVPNHLHKSIPSCRAHWI